jgi:hypothetical protein
VLLLPPLPALLLLQSGGLQQLLDLLESKQINLQHNAAFALYGLSDNEDNIPCIIQAGGLQRLYDCSEKLQVQASKVSQGPELWGACCNAHACLFLLVACVQLYACDAAAPSTGLAIEAASEPLSMLAPVSSSDRTIDQAGVRLPGEFGQTAAT